jgi:hypothetical protein
MSVIRIPIDASAIPAEDRARQNLRVAVQSAGEIVSAVVNIARGEAVAELELNTKGMVTIAVGPEQTAAADLFRRSTLQLRYVL